MSETNLEMATRKAELAEKLFKSGNSSDALKIALELEVDATQLQDPFDQAVCRKYAAGFLVDIGGDLKDEAMIRRGTQYYAEWCDKSGEKRDKHIDLYNAA